MTEGRREGEAGKANYGLTRLLTDVLTLGIAEVPGMINWTASMLIEEAEKEQLDEGKVLGELMELREQYDAGEIKEEEYDRQEKALLGRLNAIREAKKERSRA